MGKVKNNNKSNIKKDKKIKSKITPATPKAILNPQPSPNQPIVLNEYLWKLPACKNRSGLTRSAFDKKRIIHVKSDLISNEYPVILISDLHFHTPVIFPKLAEYLDLSKCIVLTMGDMSGYFNTFGDDGDPTKEYKFMSERAKEFYFVQGNHDLPTLAYEEEIIGYNHKEINNNQGRPAFIDNGQTVESLIGKISGVNGIISNRSHPYKLSQIKYINFLKEGLGRKPYILMTHDTPKINDGPGDENIYTTVNKYKPKIHLYGHCHHWDWYTYLNGVNYICADARIIIFEPINIDSDDYLLKPLAEEDLR